MEHKYKVALCIKDDEIMEFVEGNEYIYEPISSTFYNENNEGWKLTNTTIKNNFVLY